MENAMNQTLSYANEKRVVDELIGLVLKDGWTITEKVTRTAKQSGGNFSVGYIAIKDQQKAFVKAFDFEKAFEDDDPMKALEVLAQSYNFERELLEMCGVNGKSKIVRALGDGVVDREGAPLNKIYYLLFELAEGDIRSNLDFPALKTPPWRFRCLREIATALQQLHTLGIFHQDIKPSNVLLFEKGSESKLGDLGRAHCSTKAAPHDDRKIAGAYSYAPPELLYGAHSEDAKLRKAGADLYLLGSMIYFFATGIPITPELMRVLRPDHRPLLARNHGWNGSFQDVLPYLIEAHAKVLATAKNALEQNYTKEIVDLTVDLIKYATFPDPSVRGHPASKAEKHNNPYDLQRFISAFNLLSLKAGLNR